MIEFKIPERLDVTNAADVEKELMALANKHKSQSLVCDFSDTVYISSAGLRVMLLMTKQMKRTAASFILCRMQEPVFSVFKLSGFHNIMDIRESID